MKQVIALLCFGLLIGGCTGQKPAEEAKNESAATEQTPVAAVNYYGEKITEDGAIEASELLSSMQGADSMNVKVKGKIIECCKKKGCWMTVDLGDDKKMMVKFKDYAFFVPKDGDGKDVIFQGMLRKEKIEVATLKHYAEDAGKSKEEIAKITTPEEQFTFEADGVIIKN